MENRHKSFNMSNIDDNTESQKIRYKEAHYHPYDHICRIKLKQKTNNLR
ncbi:hypothetical protein [Proteiniborus sp. MB09-C3]|nr:hypothetical protein [Proteiniborus sp. MB09-C3]WIV10722.1 hypothetical protein QO263_11195 [Proteiniborus sp. MB09-C3]